MDVDWNREIRDQIELHWSRQLRPRLEGISDPEYLWEPVEGMWSVGDFEVPPPEPPPVTTIAWRLGHLVFMLEAAGQRFGGPAVDFASFTYPRSADEALRRVDAAYEIWITGVRDLGVEGLTEPAGPQDGPMAGWSTAGIVLHNQRELLHHGAEIALLRDLYRASAQGSRWAAP